MTVEVVRDDDPRCAELEAAGYRVVGESWAARLRDPDPAILQQVVLRAADVTVRELDRSYASAWHELESANEKDYPYTPATHRVVQPVDELAELWSTGRVFGAFDGERLVGATYISLQCDPPRGETGFTSVLDGYRGRGIGQAVKAASILALWADGVRVFGTGGAALNEASLGANLALGYVIEERWRSYAPAPATEAGLV
ncbi:GNAT family N-acetyltransferase [Kribbella sp. NPDC051718]|uniref:GNAT family N-acetyltransferase n=1 Tax=Kribbella sp. NPDC051718 TaxID=3155168 RepID=UPI00342F903A